MFGRPNLQIYEPEKEVAMSIAKVIEVLAEGDSFEAAVQSAVSDAADTVRGIKHVYVEGVQALVEDDKVVKYRVNAKLTFVVEPEGS
jgi:flavin-binding protein dodecin